MKQFKLISYVNLRLGSAKDNTEREREREREREIERERERQTDRQTECNNSRSYHQTI